MKQRRRIGDYEVLGELARGGMGVVYRARELAAGREVALKEVFQPDARFAQEAEAIARLDHPGIVRVHAFDPQARPPYLVMELVEGESLSDRLKQGPLTLEEALDLAQKLCAALEHAHERGVLHRDLKPSNVLIAANGEPKLTDFGLGKVIDQSQHLTQTGEILGTPGFMPPEQASGDVAAMGPASDVYGLGATIYASLTGQAPFRMRSLVEVLYAVLHTAPPPPSQLRADVPAWLDRVISRCLEKDPAARYPSAQAVSQALEEGPAQPEELRPGPLAVVVAVLGVLVVAGLWGLRRHPPAARSPAPTASSPASSVSSPPLATPTPTISPWTIPHAAEGAVAVAFAGPNRLWTAGAGKIQLWDLVRRERVFSEEDYPILGASLVARQDWILVPLNRKNGLLRLQARTASQVYSASPPSSWVVSDAAGERLAFACLDGLWVVPGPDQEPRRLETQGTRLDVGVFSPSGRFLAVIDEDEARDKHVLVWNTSDWSLAHAQDFFKTGFSSIRSLAFSGPEELIVGTSDGQLLFLSLREGLTDRLFSAVNTGWDTRVRLGSVRGLVVHGDRLFSLTRYRQRGPQSDMPPGSVSGWDLSLRRQIGASVSLEVEGAKSLDVSPDGAWLAVGGNQGRAQLIRAPSWGDLEADSRKPWRFTCADTDGVVAVAFDDLGQLLTAGGDWLRVWDVARRQQIREVAVSLNPRFVGLAWGAEGSGLLSGKSGQPGIRLGADGSTQPLDGVPVRGVVARPNSGMFAIRSHGKLSLLRPGQPPQQVGQGEGAKVTGLFAFSASGRRLVVAGRGGGGRLWWVDPDTGEVLSEHPIKGHGRSVALDRGRVLLGTSAGHLFVHDFAREGTPVEEWIDPDLVAEPALALPRAHGGQIGCLVVKGRRLYAAAAAMPSRHGGELKAWDLDTGAPIWRQPLSFKPLEGSLAVSPDGVWVAVGGAGGHVAVFPTR